LSDACPQGYRVLAGPRVGAGIVQPLTEAASEFSTKVVRYAFLISH